MADDENQENIEIKLLKKCPKELAEKFVHEVIDSICDGAQPRHLNYAQVWSTNEWRSITEAAKELLKCCMRKGLNKNEINAELDKFPLEPETKQVIVGCLIPRQDEMRAALVHSTTGITSSHLKDFDWKVKMVLASDKLAAIRKPVINVDFDIQEGNSMKPITVEMSKEELQHFISSLEAANKMVVQLKS